jgi:proteic killer suppression protein
VIQSFKDKGLARFFEKGDPSKLSVPKHAKKIAQMLQALDDASSPRDLDIPGWRYHPLQGDWAGKFSLSVSGNWRIVFKFEDGHAVDVDLEDYH